MLRLRHVALVLVTAAGLAACAGKTPPPQIGEVDTLYNTGMDQMQAHKWNSAVKTFDELDRQHPYSGWAVRGDMMTAYAQFRAEKYDDAQNTIDEFIRLHPGYKDLPYMYYLRALIDYYQIPDVSRDQSTTTDALNAFEEVVRRFPNTDYARDAKLKITLCRDHMAAQEMDIGRFYEQRKNYIAAVNRFQSVVKNFERTQQVPEALFRMTESYLALGLRDQAMRAAAVLGYNYPTSPWYRDAYNLMGKKLPAPGASKSIFRATLDGLDKLF